MTGREGSPFLRHGPQPADSPLRLMDNVVLTPHIRWTVEEVFEEFARIGCDQLQAWLKGELFVTGLL